MREDGSVATPWFQRATAFAADAAAVLAVLEASVLAVTCEGARRASVLAIDAGLTAGAVLVVALAPAALIALRPPSATWARAVIATGGLVVAAVCMRLDAKEYVRLYAPYHAALGAALVTCVVAVRATLRRGETTGAARASAIVVVAVVAGVAARGSRDAWAYVGQRGVLMADAIWATRSEVVALPPMPTSTSTASPTPTSTPRPALILLITIDALRADVARSGAYPALETVRANAVDFTDARAPAAWTVPSTYGMLTGRGPWNVRWTRAAFFGETARPYDGPDAYHTRVWPSPLEDRSPTLPEALHALGYETRTCASLPLLNRSAGVTRGFDVIDEGVYRMRNPTMRGITSDMLTACGIAMIDAAKGAPLFLWLHYSDPHEPYLEHAGAATMGAGESAKARYEGEVAFVDKHLGGLLVNVQKRVGLERTLVVVTADHGEEFGEHGGEFHGATLYDEILRVPLLVATPGIAPRRVDAPVSLLDVAPTIVELAGGGAFVTPDGRSLASAMRGDPPEARPVFAETIRYGRGSRAIVEGQWKLVYEARARTWELFDLGKDPGEQRVVTDENGDVFRGLAGKMGIAP